MEVYKKEDDVCVANAECPYCSGLFTQKYITTQIDRYSPA